MVNKPAGLKKISAARIALWDTYGGSMPSGWIRYIMEQYHFPIDIIYPSTIDAGNLNAKYDVIVFAPVGHASSSDIIDGLLADLAEQGVELTEAATDTLPNDAMMRMTPM